MEVELRELKRKDYAKAIQYAITGMHFHWYLDSRFLLNLYGRYFWYLELGRATQVIAAYVGDRLAGVLLAEMKGEPKQTRSFGDGYTSEGLNSCKMPSIRTKLAYTTKQTETC